MIVAKAINMANMMEVPVVGLVENMAYFVCPDCGGEHSVFGTSDVKALAEQYGIEHTARLPLDAHFAKSMDKGEAAQLEIPELQDFAQELLKQYNVELQ